MLHFITILSPLKHIFTSAHVATQKTVLDLWTHVPSSYAWTVWPVNSS